MPRFDGQLINRKCKTTYNFYSRDDWNKTRSAVNFFCNFDQGKERTFQKRRGKLTENYTRIGSSLKCPTMNYEATLITWTLGAVNPLSSSSGIKIPKISIPHPGVDPSASITKMHRVNIKKCIRFN